MEVHRRDPRWEMKESGTVQKNLKGIKGKREMSGITQGLRMEDGVPLGGGRMKRRVGAGEVYEDWDGLECDKRNSG